MRCNNCGWENPDGSTLCEKCNSPLRGGVGRQSSPSSEGLHSTVRESVPFNKPATQRTEIETGTLGSGTIVEPPVDVQTPPRKTLIDPEPPAPSNPTGGKGTFGGTINPYAGMGFVPVKHCKLSPVIFPGEDKRDVPGDACFKGGYNELNRANLDPENGFITSKVQAVLTNKDGKWYIQDQSAQKTTFVRAEQPTPLKDGDIILMGNRTFIFNED